MTQSRESRVGGGRGKKEGYGGKETAKVRQLRERGVGGGAKFIIALHFILP